MNLDIKSSFCCAATEYVMQYLPSLDQTVAVMRLYFAPKDLAAACFVNVGMVTVVGVFVGGARDLAVWSSFGHARCACGFLQQSSR